MTTMQTYTVHIRASAARSLKVQARSPIEAAEKAEARVARSTVHPWVIDFPGDFDEHFRVDDASGEPCDLREV